MSVETFKPGDTVTLKSGGLTMTVAWIDSAKGTVYCRWLNGSGDSRDDGFMPVTLKLADQAP